MWDTCQRACTLPGQLAMHESPVLIIVPGWRNSGPGHWQSILQRQWPEALRAQQQDWETPARQDWVDTLADTILAQRRPVLLAAHSLGCITVAHLPDDAASHVEGALLVAPANPVRHPALAGFAPVPMRQLPFHSIVVASDDDPYCNLDTARHFSIAWGSDFERLQNAGHINVEAGFGHWPRAQALLEILAERASAQRLREHSLLFSFG